MTHHETIVDIKLRVNVEKNNRIDYELYEKPSKNSKVLLPGNIEADFRYTTELDEICKNNTNWGAIKKSLIANDNLTRNKTISTPTPK